MSKKIDISSLIGARFGRLTILKGLGVQTLWVTNKRRGTKVLAKCDCGAVGEYYFRYLLIGNTKSCGCLKIELAKERCRKQHGAMSSNYKDGRTGSFLYRVYHDIIQRCYNSKNKWYKDYGGRGIKVCSNWLGDDGYVNFVRKMGPTYGRGLQIDRINNNGDYSSANCRWVTSKRNNRNRRNNYLVSYNGETKTMAEWAEQYNIPYATLYYRIEKFKWSIEKALITPVQKRKSGANKKV